MSGTDNDVVRTGDGINNQQYAAADGSSGSIGQENKTQSNNSQHNNAPSDTLAPLGYGRYPQQKRRQQQQQQQLLQEQQQQQQQQQTQLASSSSAGNYNNNPPNHNHNRLVHIYSGNLPSGSNPHFVFDPGQRRLYSISDANTSLKANLNLTPVASDNSDTSMSVVYSSSLLSEAGPSANANDNSNASGGTSATDLNGQVQGGLGLGFDGTNSYVRSNSYDRSNLYSYSQIQSNPLLQPQSQSQNMNAMELTRKNSSGGYLKEHYESMRRPLPILNYQTFLYTMLFVTFTNWIGYLCVYICSTSRDTKYGAQAGLGLSFSKIAILFMYTDSFQEIPAESARRSLIIVCWTIMIFGAFYCTRAIMSYSQVRNFHWYDQ